MKQLYLILALTSILSLLLNSCNSETDNTEDKNTICKPKCGDNSTCIKTECICDTGYIKDNKTSLCVGIKEMGSSLHKYNGAPEDLELVNQIFNNHHSLKDPLRIIYVAPLSGSEDGTGESRENPRRDLKSALENAQAGDHFYLAPGVYRIDQIKDTFSHGESLLLLRNSGTAENKIVVRTDPELYNPEAGEVAQIDYNFDNFKPNHDDHAIGLYASYWSFLNLEVRNMNDWGFYVTGKYNLIKDCELHNLNHPGTNNMGLIVVATSGPSYNLFMGNHLHHSGKMTEEKVLDGEIGGQNGGCTYTVTRQHYNTDFSSLPEEPSYEEIQAILAPVDSETYFYNNLVHHCHGAGLGTKNTGNDGPFHFLSNIIHTTTHAMRVTLNHTVVRNNLIYKGEWMHEGILYGWAPSTDIYSQIKNAVGITIEKNTFVGMNTGIIHRGGWNGVIKDNIFLNVKTPHYVLATWLKWFPGWPWAIGEYIISDLNEENPYYESMPPSLKSRKGHYFKLNTTGNIYSSDPSLKVETPGRFDNLGGTYLSDDHQVLDATVIESSMINPLEQDYRMNLSSGSLTGKGSGVQ